MLFFHIHPKSIKKKQILQLKKITLCKKITNPKPSNKIKLKVHTRIEMCTHTVWTHIFPLHTSNQSKSYTVTKTRAFKIHVYYFTQQHNNTHSCAQIKPTLNKKVQYRMCVKIKIYIATKHPFTIYTNKIY